MSAAVVDGSLTGQMRALLRKAGEPVSIHTICTALALDAEQKRQAQKNLHNMRARGEINLITIDGKTHYAAVEGFELRQRRSTAPAAKPAPAETKAARCETKPVNSAPKAPEPETPEPAVVAPDQDMPRAPERYIAVPVTISLRAEGGAGGGSGSGGAGGAGGAGAAPPARTAMDFDLSKRIDVIRDDIDDALGDAITHGHAKELLMQLHIALGAMTRAGRAYPRN